MYFAMYQKCMNIQIILINLTRKMQISQELRHKCNIIIMHFAQQLFIMISKLDLNNSNRSRDHKSVFLFKNDSTKDCTL